ncbi:MAG TPA: cupin domain-containing protein, partial [Pseudolabrys sp.]|nr:cupin domain-containing protein [Pseudolabrys sp.]
MTALPGLLLASPNSLSFLLDRPVNCSSVRGAAARTAPSVLKEPAMSTDVLSELLSAVRLSGSVFFDVHATAPWVAEAPPAAQIANDVTPG